MDLTPQLLFPRTPDLRQRDESAFRQTLADYFHSTFSTYESLFEALVDEDSYRIKPISLRHPLIFYLGHTATFFTNKLILAGLISERINPRFESMFAVGVDEMSWDDLNEAHYDWPTAAEVRAYRDAVRATVDRIIREAPLQLPVDWDNPWWAIIMGVEHERIHLETSTVLIRQHALERVRPVAAWAPDRSGLAAAAGLMLRTTRWLPSQRAACALASPSTTRFTAGTTSTASAKLPSPRSRLRSCWSATPNTSPSSRPAAMPTHSGGTRRAKAGAATRRPPRRPSGSVIRMAGSCV